MPAVLFTAIFEGHVIIGGWLSATVTVNIQDEVPQSLVAVAVTVVVPTGNKVPETGEYVIVGTGAPVASPRSCDSRPALRCT